MNWHEYRLDNSVLRVGEPLILCKTEQCVVEIDKGAVAVRLILNEETAGYVFQGNAKLLVDTIVQTDRGSFGKPLERKVERPFLMLGDTADLRNRLSKEADREDIVNIGYPSKQDFLVKIEELGNPFTCEQFHEARYCCEISGRIFAFQNDAGMLDLLIVDGSKLVYRAADRLFILDQNRAVLRTPEEVVLSSGNGSCIAKSRNRSADAYA